MQLDPAAYLSSIYEIRGDGERRGDFDVLTSLNTLGMSTRWNCARVSAILSELSNGLVLKSPAISLLSLRGLRFHVLISERFLNVFSNGSVV